MPALVNFTFGVPVAPNGIVAVAVTKLESELHVTVEQVYKQPILPSAALKAFKGNTTTKSHAAVALAASTVNVDIVTSSSVAAIISPIYLFIITSATADVGAAAAGIVDAVVGPSLAST